MTDIINEITYLPSTFRCDEKRFSGDWVVKSDWFIQIFCFFDKLKINASGIRFLVCNNVLNKRRTYICAQEIAWMFGIMSVETTYFVGCFPIWSPSKVLHNWTFTCSMCFSVHNTFINRNWIFWSHTCSSRSRTSSCCTLILSSITWSPTQQRQRN